MHGQGVVRAWHATHGAGDRVDGSAATHGCCVFSHAKTPRGGSRRRASSRLSVIEKLPELLVGAWFVIARDLQRGAKAEKGRMVGAESSAVSVI